MAKKAGVSRQGARQEAIQRVATGLAAMLHPEHASCSFTGREYKPDADGIVLVPIRAVPQLVAHGFSPVEESATRTPVDGVRSGFDTPGGTQMERSGNERLVVGPLSRVDGSGSKPDRPGGAG
jgi:hypothetical protein